MTTIAFDGYDLAADGRETTDGIITASKVQKIYKIPNGWFAGAGAASDCVLVADWLISGGLPADRPVRKKPSKEATFEGMVVDEDGNVFYLPPDLMTMVPQEAPQTVGSGGLVAFTAMNMGKTAREAVEIAAKLDVNTGGKITVIPIKPRKRKH